MGSHLSDEIGGLLRGHSFLARHLLANIGESFCFLGSQFVCHSRLKLPLELRHSETHFLWINFVPSSFKTS